MTKNKTIRKTSIGKAKYSYISEPDTQYDPKGVYHLSIEFTKAEAEPEIKAIEEVIAGKIAELKKAKPEAKEIKLAPKPYKEEDGKIVIKFKSKFKPKIWDKDGKHFNEEKSIYKGSTMSIKYKLNAYDQSIGVGCSLYLLHCKIINLVESSEEDKCPL